MVTQKHVRAVSMHLLPLIDFETRVFEVSEVSASFGFKLVCVTRIYNGAMQLPD